MFFLLWNVKFTSFLIILSMSNRIKNGLFHVRRRNFLWIAYTAGRHHAGGGGGCCVAVSVSRWMVIHASSLRAMRMKSWSYSYPSIQNLRILSHIQISLRIHVYSYQSLSRKNSFLYTGKKERENGKEKRERERPKGEEKQSRGCFARKRPKRENPWNRRVVGSCVGLTEGVYI